MAEENTPTTARVDLNCISVNINGQPTSTKNRRCETNKFGSENDGFVYNTIINGSDEQAYLYDYGVDGAKKNNGNKGFDMLAVGSSNEIGTTVAYARNDAGDTEIRKRGGKFQYNEGFNKSVKVDDTEKDGYLEKDPKLNFTDTFDEFNLVRSRTKDTN